MSVKTLERRLKGVPAAPGLALGIVTRLAASPIADGARARPTGEVAALEVALAAAAAELSALAAWSDELGSEILEFQVALLEDEDLLAPIREAVVGGADADAAWMQHLSAEIVEYETAGDAYLAARASDLRDLRDRVLDRLRGRERAIEAEAGAVLVAEDLAPSAFLALHDARLAGVAIAGGSPTSHVAILARAGGVPMLVGLDADALPATGETVALDAEAGELVVGPSAAYRAAFEARLAASAAAVAMAAAAARRPAGTFRGRAIRVLVNVDDPRALDGLDPAICDGIGLTRSEFLYADGPPGEEAQLATYLRIIRWAAGRPVTIRTLDAGGDKPIPGVTIDGETNPFLGVRGLRLSLARPELFRLQLRTLARAAAHGPLKVMLPMVTVPAELEAARAHLDASCAELAAEGIDHARPALGIMVETPAAALTAADFDAAFYSIGSNDLIQYVTAAARDSARLGALADPRHPAVLELIRRTVEAGRARGVETSLCGDMASRPDLARTLLELGLDTFSVAPALVGAVKHAIGEACASVDR